jgi:hypothetical protein
VPLEEVSVSDQQYVGARPPHSGLEVADAPEPWDQFLRLLEGAGVVHETDHGEPVAGMARQELRQLRGQCAPSDEDRAVHREAVPAAPVDDRRDHHPPGHDEPDGDRRVHEEGRHRMLFVPEHDRGGNDSGGGQESAQEVRQFVEHAEVQTRPVAPEVGLHEQEESDHRDDGLGLIRGPQDRGRQQEGVDREHQHPGPDPVDEGPTARLRPGWRLRKRQLRYRSRCGVRLGRRRTVVLEARAPRLRNGLTAQCSGHPVGDDGHAGPR